MTIYNQFAPGSSKVTDGTGNATAAFQIWMRNVWLRGPAPLHADVQRVVGPAFTLRFVPAREDLATPASWAAR